MSKFIVALAIATSANVYSGNVIPVVDTAVKTTPWDIIGRDVIKRSSHRLILIICYSSRYAIRKERGG